MGCPLWTWRLNVPFYASFARTTNRPMHPWATACGPLRVGTDQEIAGIFPGRREPFRFFDPISQVLTPARDAPDDLHASGRGRNARCSHASPTDSLHEEFPR